MDAVEEEEVGSASRLPTRAAMKKIMSLPRIACWTDLQMDHQEHTEGQNSRVGVRSRHRERQTKAQGGCVHLFSLLLILWKL